MDCRTTRVFATTGLVRFVGRGLAGVGTSSARRVCAHVSRGQLQVVHSIVTPENVNDIVAGARLPATVDFVSIDIDRHTHSIWEALGVKARVHCIEYNGSIPPSLD